MDVHGVEDEDTYLENLTSQMQNLIQLHKFFGDVTFDVDIFVFMISIYHWQANLKILRNYAYRAVS